MLTFMFNVCVHVQGPSHTAVAVHQMLQRAELLSATVPLLSLVPSLLFLCVFDLGGAVNSGMFLYCTYQWLLVVLLSGRHGFDWCVGLIR